MDTKQKVLIPFPPALMAKVTGSGTLRLQRNVIVNALRPDICGERQFAATKWRRFMGSRISAHSIRHGCRCVAL
jgi:hypothetical protein